jgi:pimeloyl-ACP methyl ester carboxylesterase
LPLAPDAPFYLPPSPLPAGKPGDLIRTTELAARDSARIFAILYRSTGLAVGAVAESGLVIVPEGPPPDRPRSLVVIAHGTAGLADQCAPSADPSSVLSDTVSRLLADGDAVVAPDYEGLGTPGPSPYLVGISEGRSILDAARAALGVADAHAGSPIAIVGDSQGGHAAIWAGQLARSYAPELKLIGVAATAPATDITAIAHDLFTAETTPFQAYAGMLVAAAYSEVYKAPLAKLLVPAAIAQVPTVLAECADAAATLPVAEPFLAGGDADPTWHRLFEQNTPGAARTTVPYFILQGDADMVVPVGSTQAGVARMCRIGDRVKLTIVAGATHDTIVAPAEIDAIRAWLADLATGKPAPTTC